MKILTILLVVSIISFQWQSASAQDSGPVSNFLDKAPSSHNDEIPLTHEHEHKPETEQVALEEGHEHAAEQQTHVDKPHAGDERHADNDHSAGGHSDKDAHEESEKGTVELSEASANIAGIKVATLALERVFTTVSAPGEVQLNQYSSAEVVPLIDAVVIARHAHLGDLVDVGDSLVTLASVAVAEAQGQLRIASSEWQRARKLGRAAVGAKRYTQAEVAYEQARLILGAYGLDANQIDATVSGELAGSLGRFDLGAPVPGTILRDDFRVGQRIAAGERLFLIADEAQIWIEANLSPAQADGVNVGVGVKVNMKGHWHAGKVIQKHHLLDEQTRTIPVRIAVDADGEHHHAGEFVQVSIDFVADQASLHTAAKTLVVPESALMQDEQQNWTVFVEQKPGHFRQTVISRGHTRGSRVAISGIEEGSMVVTEGAFFLASELAKGGFDIHDH